jgi:ADP-ribose pyrophosphatase YjhB (NUDIX family)
VGVLHHNMTKVRKAPEKEYNNFRKYFAFSCVDMIILNGKSVLLTKRTRNPYKGYWHLPGSMVHKDETLHNAVKRSAKEELGLNVKIKKFIGVYESLNKFRHDVSHGFLVVPSRNKIKTDFQSDDYGFFAKLPSKTLPHHKKMITDALKSRHK